MSPPTLPTYVLKITSGRDPSCSRTIEFRGDLTLEDIHYAIQREFDLDNDHLWAFFLSGVLGDRGSEFASQHKDEFGRIVAHSPDTRLDSLDLEPGHEFVYLFDFGDKLRHDLDVVRVGRVQMHDKEHELPLVLERQGTPPPQYPSFEDETTDEDDPDTDEEEPLDPASERVLAAMASLRASLNSETNPDLSEVRAHVRTVLDAAPDHDSLVRIVGHLDVPVYGTVSHSLDDLLAAEKVDEQDLALAERWARISREWPDLKRWALALASAGRERTALDELAAFEATGPLANERDALRASLLCSMRSYQEAEPVLTRLLSKRWLASKLRKRCNELMDGVLRATGRSAEADRRNDRSLERAVPKGRPVAFKSAKVSPNDRCPCGSGKKYKRCCGGR